MPANTPELSPDHIRWAIDARARSQQLMLDLHAWGGARGFRPGRVDDDQPVDHDTDIYATLVGASFSLWRAAFLANTPTRTWAGALGDAQAVLENVLQTNTVMFTTEQKHYGWTGGYYLDNARLRLRDVLDREVQAGRAEPSERDAVAAISLFHTDPRDMWAALCTAAERALARLQATRK